jgi:molecular chaperone GrpE
MNKANQDETMEAAIAEALAAVDSVAPEVVPEVESVDASVQHVAEAAKGSSADVLADAVTDAVQSLTSNAEATSQAGLGAEALAADAAGAEDAVKATKALDELKTRHMRLMADFDNYRKRVQRDQQIQRRFSGESIARDLLPVVDNIERALSVSPGGDEAGSMSEGVTMILNQTLAMLERHGVRPFDSVGERFDPECHEAVARQGHPDFEEDYVCEEMQRGYYFHERLLRAATVIVSGGKLDSPSDSSSNGGVSPEAKS